jgi:hypothetical protein
MDSKVKQTDDKSFSSVKKISFNKGIYRTGTISPL